LFLFKPVVNKETPVGRAVAKIPLFFEKKREKINLSLKKNNSVFY
jgi:hypothetical protein